MLPLLTFVPQIYGVIFLGSTTAFSAMVSAAIVFQQTSCILPQGILLIRGRGILPPRHFQLGRWGYFVNTTAVAWVVFLDVMYCFPTTMPATPQNMSYVSVVSVGLVAIVLVMWFATKKRTFKGPKIDYDLLAERRLEGLRGEGPVMIGEETLGNEVKDVAEISGAELKA